MSAPRVLVEPRAVRAPVELRQDPNLAWAWLGWFGGVITLVAAGDLALAWYPFRVGVPEWEFGTIAASFAGLPLLTMGMAGLLGSMLARGRRLGTIVVSVLMLLLGVAVLAALVIFALDIPIALRVVTPEVAVGIKKAIAKTVMLGVVFSMGYVVAAVAALRHAMRGRTGDSA